MKILLVHNFYRTSAPSGEDIVVQNEQKMLSNVHEVITYFKHNDDLDEASFRNRVSMAMNAIWSISSFREVTKLIEKHNPAVMHVHNTFPQISPSVYLAARSMNVPVIQTLHNYRMVCANGLLLRNGRPCELCLTSSPRAAVRYKCYRNSVSATATVVGIQVVNKFLGSYRRNVDTFIALTDFAKRKLQSEQVRYVDFSIKPNFLPDAPAPGGYPRERQAVFVGRLTEEKGIWTLIRAWPSASGYRLVVVGDGALRPELEKYFAEQRLNISFMGHCSREIVLDLLRSSALQIIPSLWYEGFPMVVLEAYACGTAVLASRLGGLAEVVVEGITGRLFPAGDIESLRTQILNLLGGEETYVLGAAGRRVFEGHYTEAENAKLLLSIYNDAIARNKSKEMAT